MFGAGLSVVWVSDLSSLNQILDRVLEPEAIISEVAGSLMKLTVGIWIVVGCIRVWCKSGWFRFEEALSLESFKYLR